MQNKYVETAASEKETKKSVVGRFVNMVFQVHKARHKETGRLAAAKICQLESDEVRFLICCKSCVYLWLVNCSYAISAGAL